MGQITYGIVNTNIKHGADGGMVRGKLFTSSVPGTLKVNCIWVMKLNRDKIKAPE